MTGAVGAGTAPSLRAAVLARAAFALLVVASVAALFYAQVLKRRPPLVDEPTAWTDRFQPSGSGVRVHREAHFGLRTTVDELVDVWVVTPAGRVIDSLDANLPMQAYSHRPLHWDGVTASGAPAPPGTYELRVRLERTGQTLIVPGFSMKLESPAA